MMYYFWRYVFRIFPESFGFHRLISLRNNLFMFGGYDRDKHEYLDTIYQCNTKEMKWSKLDIKMPKQLYLFGCTTAINDKYVLIFGGYSGHYHSDDIYILSLLTKRFTKSQIKCPTKSKFEAITTNDRYRDELAVFGFVRSSWQSSQIPDHYFPPHYMLSLMHSYYLMEFVH